MKNPPANAGNIRDAGSTPGSGRSPGGGHGNLFQYSCLKNQKDRGTWWATVHGDAKSWIRLSDFHFQLLCNAHQRSISIPLKGFE